MSLQPWQILHHETCSKTRCVIGITAGVWSSCTASSMEQDAGGRTASALFAGFRALGLFSNDIPHVVRFSALKRRFYVTTCVGKSFHTYDVSDFFLRPLPGNHLPRPPVRPWVDSILPALSPPSKGFAFCFSLS